MLSIADSLHAFDLKHITKMKPQLHSRWLVLLLWMKENQMLS